MATIATDGKGNYVALDANGNWQPTAAPTAPQKGGGELGYQAAPPEADKPTIDFANRPGQSPAQQDDLGLPVPRSPPPGGLVDTSTQPGPNVATLMPLSRDDAGNIRFALPNAVRAILHEGPQVNDGKFSVPGATIDQGSGELGLTPEAVTGGMLLAPAAGLRFSADRNVLMREPQLRTDQYGPPEAPPPAPPSFLPPGTPTPPSLMPAKDPRTSPTPAFVPPTTSTSVEGAVTPITNPLAPKVAPDGSVTPPTPAAPVDPAIMSQADMRARGHGYFNAADQAASQGAMLPDTNATAVRKLFGDFIPSDPEAARISAGEPAMQAAKNVDATGPMSYDTAMRIDRDLTSRMRGASGTDAHDLSQLQQGLRDQMDQVPDLANLRPGRQAWMQSIKQGQMEDINAGAALKNDPAQADTYVRQRAAALLKNDNAMRYWTPEEQAQLTQVAKSGDIGTLGRLSVSLIKPITRVALGAVGHSIAGPMGAIVGSEIGGDVGATQAGRLRSYLSKTTLDPVMEQITRGVPPRNVLMQPPT